MPCHALGLQGTGVKCSLNPEIGLFSYMGSYRKRARWDKHTLQTVHWQVANATGV